MVEESKAWIPAKYDSNGKWDECLKLGVRFFVYSSLAGGFAGLLLFRSPQTRWACVAFGAGLGLVLHTQNCVMTLMDLHSPPKLTPNISDAPLSKAEE